MTTTETRYPSKIDQLIGENYQPFNGLKNIKTAKGYAESSSPITSKKGNKNRPSTLWLYNYKFNIPSDAEVTKVTISYKWGKIGACTENKQKKPCKSEKKMCNVGAPKIVLTNKCNENAKTFVGEYTVKGQAPTTDPKKQTITLNLDRNDTVPYWFWNKDFYVAVNFPENSNKQDGYIRVYYVTVKISYVRPSYGIKLQKVSGGYNNEELRLKATISNKNLTRYNPTVTITAPLGFTYKGKSGDGKITKVNNRTFNWTPTVKNKGSSNVELIFDTNVTYSSSTSSYDATFTAGVPTYNLTNSLTTTITERPPNPETKKDTTDTDTYGDKDSEVDKDNRVWATLNQAFNFILQFTSEEIERYSEDSTLYINFQGYKDDTRSTNWYYIDTDGNEHQLTDNLYIQLNANSEYTFDGSFLVKNTYGDYALKVYGLVGGSSPQELIRELTISIRPPVDTLETPNLSILSLTEEELHRLGDYTYTVQSDMELVNETLAHINDWTKNFRLGVFNNRIEANCTDYILLQSDSNSQDRELNIPARYTLDDVTCEIQTSNAININLDNGDTTYLVTESIPVPLTDSYNIPVVLSHAGFNSVNLKLCIYDNQNTLLYEGPYTVVFNASETLPPTQQTDDSTDYNNLSKNDIYRNAEYWSTEQAGLNETNNVTLEFVYDENYPLYIIITAEYFEEDIGTTSLKFTEPCIVESTEYTKREENGVYPTPIDDSVIGDGSISEVTIEPFKKSSEIVFYDLPLEEDYGTDTTKAIRGIELIGNIAHSDELVLYANLKSPNGESRQRSIVLTDTDTEFSIGGMGDLWGFSTLDLVNLEEWEVDFTISNVLQETEGIFNFGDIQLVIYIETVDTQNVKCYINDEDIAYYGAFITDLKIPEGLDTDTDYLSVDGTDTNDAYRQNIREKEITIEIDIGDTCDITQNTMSLREFTKLLVNDRDEYNRPIPKTIRFSHYPDVYWEYVMEDTFDTELEINTYHIKAKLTVPAGTSYDINDTTTSSSGYINGIASINPIVTVTPTDDVITVTETISNQRFNIGYSGDWNGKVLEIHTDNRKVYLRTDEDDTEPIDLTSYVDFNSDWFTLKGEYTFEGTNCVIRTVTFSERW